MTQPDGFRYTGRVLITASSVLFCLCVGALRCQEPAPAGPPRPGRRVYDGVRVIIGDRVILQSTLEREIRSQIEAMGMASNTPLAREDELRIRDQVMTRFARDEVWIEYGKSLGERDPKQFEQAIDSEVDSQLKDEIRASGGMLQFDRDVGDLGTSWTDLRRQKRNSILTQIAKRNAIAPLINNQGLLVTPREIRAYFDEHPEQFSQPETADIQRIGFSIERDPAATQARVQEAAVAWRAGTMSASQIAKQYGGIALETQRDVRPGDADERSKELKNFAATHKIGEVSDPIRSGRKFFTLLRVEAKTEAIEVAFTDPLVQMRIRERLAEIHYVDWQNDVLRRKRRNIYTWPPALDLER